MEKRFLEADPKIFINKYGIKDFILNVGHIGIERKNTLTLIKALSKIDHPAVIIGKIYNTSEGLSCIKEAKKNKNLIIIDGLDHNSKMLESAYAASKVFVLPAKYETPGIAGLEAGLAGSKIVITKYGGTTFSSPDIMPIAKDPVINYERHLVKKKIYTEVDIKKIREEMKVEINAAVKESVT